MEARQPWLRPSVPPGGRGPPGLQGTRAAARPALARWLLATRWEPWPILLLASAALFLRLWRLGEWSLWVDEVLTTQRAQGLDTLGYMRWTPTHLLVRAAFELFGASEWSARVTPALIGAATIPALALLFRRITDRRIALVAAGLLAFCPWHLYWSQCSRGYAALLLFYAVGLVLLHDGLERGRLGALVGGGVLLSLAVLERRYTVLNLGLTLGTLAGLQGFRGIACLRRRGRALAVTAAVLVAAVAAYEGVATLTGSERILEEFFKFLHIGSALGSRGMLAQLVEKTGLPLLVLAALGTLRPGVWGTRAGRLTIAAAWVPVLALLTMTHYVRVYDRFAFVALPFLCLLAAGFLGAFLSSRRPVPRLAGALAALWLAFAASGALEAYYGGHGGRANWRTTLQAVDARREKGDLLVFHGAILARHYLGDDLEIRSIDPGTKPGVWLQDSLPPGRRIWLLLPRSIAAGLGGWLARHGRRVETDPAGAGELWLVSVSGEG